MCGYGGRRHVTNVGGVLVRGDITVVRLRMRSWESEDDKYYFQNRYNKYIS